MEVFVNERDRILAHSLMTSANCAQEPYGEAVTVVGIMGVDHLDGVLACWMNAGDIRPLLTTPRPSLVSSIIWSGIKFSFRIGLFVLISLGLYYTGRIVIVLRRLSFDIVKYSYKI